MDFCCMHGAFTSAGCIFFIYQCFTTILLLAFYTFTVRWILTNRALHAHVLITFTNNIILNSLRDEKGASEARRDSQIRRQQLVSGIFLNLCYNTI